MCAFNNCVDVFALLIRGQLGYSGKGKEPGGGTETTERRVAINCILSEFISS